MNPTTYKGYVPIPQAVDAIEKLVPGLPRPSDKFIRREVDAQRVRAIRVGPRRLLVNLEDVRNLIVPLTPAG